VIYDKNKIPKWTNNVGAAIRDAGESARRERSSTRRDQPAYRAVH
jgi:hypothetical protein